MQTAIPAHLIQTVFDFIQPLDVPWELCRNDAGYIILTHDIAELPRKLEIWEVAQLDDSHNVDFICCTRDYYITWDGDLSVRIEGHGTSAAYSLRDFGFEGEYDAEALRTFFVERIQAGQLFS